MLGSERSKVFLGHRGQDSEFGGMGNKYLRPDGERGFDLGGETRQMFDHLNYGLVSGRGFRAGSSTGSGKGGGGLSLRFSPSPRAACAFRLGDGPRAFGFSMRTILPQISQIFTD
jgi:hypothetical protein